MLKYLFQCLYKDGSVFCQNPEDISSTDPKRSAFYDVKHDQLEKFALFGEGNIYAVDLITGHFEINGVQFFLHSIDRDNPLKDFRLIFFRRHRHFVNVGFTDGEQSSFEETDHVITYQFGWQTNDEQGNNIQRIVEIE